MKTLRLQLPEPTVNYAEHDDEKAIDYALNSFYAMSISLSETLVHKQDIYLSKSSIDFEDSLNPVRLKHEAGREFIEFTAGSYWTEDIFGK